MSLLRRRWPLVLLALAPLLALWRGVFLGEAVGPFDQIRQMAPWNGPEPAQPWDVLQADGVIQFYAWRDLVLSSWGRGTIPMWNPYQLAGTPLLPNSQSGALYPPHVILGLLHVPTGTAMVLLAWFHLALAGIGTFAFVRTMGGSRNGAVLAGLMFGLSPFMLAWTGLPSVISTVAWIPWVLAGVVATFRRSSVGWSIGLAGAVAMMLLAGHLQFAAYGLMAMGLFAVMLASMRSREAEGEPRPRPLLASIRVALLVVVGIGLAAPQLLPVIRFGEFSHRRGGPPTSVGYDQYVASALRTGDLVNRVANPFGQGNPTQKVAPEAPFSTFWPAMSRQGANYAESALTVGPFAFALLGLLIASRRKLPAAIPLSVLGGLALLLALGTPLNQLLYFFAPGWSSTGSPGRVICLFVLAICALAGLALPENPIEDSKKAGIGVTAGAFLSLITLVPLVDAAPQGMAADVWTAITGAASGAALGFLVSVVLAAVGVWAAATGKAGGAATLLGSFLAATLIQNLPGLVRMGDPSFLHSRPLDVPVDARVAVVNDPWGLTVAAPALYPPNTPTVARVHDLAGYDSLLHRDTVAMLKEVSGADPAALANGNIMFVKPTAGSEAMAEAGVTEVWSRRELPQLGTPFATTSSVLRYRLAGPGRASSPSGPAKIEEETLQKLVVRAIGPGRLVVRDRYHPGWQATIDSKPVRLQESRWREVDLPPGEHLVEFTFLPPGFTTGIYAAIGSLSVLIMWALFANGRKSAS